MELVLVIVVFTVAAVGGAIFRWIDGRTDAPIMRTSVRSGSGGNENRGRHLMRNWQQFHEDDNREQSVFLFHFHEHDVSGESGGQDSDGGGGDGE